jgi:predicted dehydrogenase
MATRDKVRVGMSGLGSFSVALANALEDGWRMIAACKEPGVTLMIGHVHRRHAANRKVKELIGNRAISRPVDVES